MGQRDNRGDVFAVAVGVHAHQRQLGIRDQSGARQGVQRRPARAHPDDAVAQRLEAARNGGLAHAGVGLQGFGRGRAVGGQIVFDAVRHGGAGCFGKTGGMNRIFRQESA